MREREKKTQPSLEVKPNPGPKTHFPPGDSEGPVGREGLAAQARAGVAGGRNVTLIRPGSKITKKGRTMHNAQAVQGRQTHEALQERAGKRLEVCNIIGRV